LPVIGQRVVEPIRAIDVHIDVRGERQIIQTRVAREVGPKGGQGMAKKPMCFSEGEGERLRDMEVPPISDVRG
jgi:hypothetical protein